MTGEIHIVADPDVTWDNYEATAARWRAAGYDGVLNPDEMARVTRFLMQGLDPNQALEKTMNETTEVTQTTAPGELPLYKCHKVVRAAKIAGFEFEPAAETQYVALQFDREESPRGVIVEDTWLLMHAKPTLGEASGDKGPLAAAAEKAVGGYYVVYDDGYTSWSPGEVFEAGYTPFGGEAPSPLTAEDVLRNFEYETRLHFHRIPNGHIGDAHAGGWLARVTEKESGSLANYAIGANPEDTMPVQIVAMQEGTFNETGINGFTIENLLAVVIDRLKQFQDSDFKCQENKMAIHYAEQALGELNARTNRRIARGVEGTRQV